MLPIKRLLLVTIVIALAAACSPVKKKTPPVPAWVPNPAGLPPAVADGPAPANSPTLTKTDVVTGLSRPWDVGFLPSGEMIFDERVGAISVRLLDGTIRPLVAPSDAFITEDFFGLLGLAVDPDFATNRFIYACYTSSLGDIRVVRWAVNETLDGTTSATPIVTGIPVAIAPNLGCRIRFGPDGALWITTGDIHDGNVPQDLTRLGGKVLRVTREGAPVAGNYSGQVYTYGHRNPQGIAFDPVTGQAYSIEHGTNRDDEVNRLVPGGNGGWDPKPGYNELVPMTDLVKFPDAMLPAWRSGDAGAPPASGTIAPSGGTFLDGPHWGSWDGALAVATLKGRHLRVMFFANGVVTATTSVLGEYGTRLRSAVQGPDGSLYIATDVGDRGGAIWRVTPT